MRVMLHKTTLFSLILLCCGLARPDHAHAGGALPSARETTLVGVLTKQATKQCLAKWKHRWVDPHYQVGFVRIEPAQGLQLAPLVGQLVQVRGHAKVIRSAKVSHEGPCLAMQMRSDWVEGPSGMRIRRGSRVGFGGFHARTVRAIKPLSARRRGDQLLVSFKNTLKVSLGPTTLRLHYEGCYGKPGSMHEDRRFKRIKAGQTVTARFPAIGMRAGRGPGRTVHRATSVQVLDDADKDRVVFDLDWVLRGKGLKLGCPRQR